MSTRQVTLDGGSPWGFRMHGGADVLQPLRISRVNPGSKAAQKGIREGDLISTINGQSSKGITNSEAHALLKNSGECLTLGLNQDGSGSPKRRAQRTHDPDNIIDKRGETRARSAASRTTTGEPVGDNCSQRTASISARDSVSISNLGSVPDNAAMPDNGKSRSRRRRNRKKSRKLIAVQQHDVRIVEVSDKAAEVDDTTPQGSGSASAGAGPSLVSQLQNTSLGDTVTDECYRVDSPKTVRKETNSMKKSKSLDDDDDDDVKITEVTDCEGEIHDMSESVAIISDADSDVEWETAENLTVQHSLEQHCGRLSTISIPLLKQLDTNPWLSEEREKHLRDFLGNLNLVESMEESVRRAGKNVDKARLEKLKKRQAVAQHFLPYYQNPRYLDVISEETSDISDKDHKQEDLLLGSHNARPLIIDPLRTHDVAEVKKIHRKQDEAILVDAKLIENTTEDNCIQYPWSTSLAESRSGAEVVYLEDSSASETPSDALDQEESGDADEEDEDSVDLDSTETTAQPALVPTSEETPPEDSTVQTDYRDVIQVLEELEKSCKNEGNENIEKISEIHTDTDAVLTEFDIEFQAFCDELRNSGKQEESRPSSSNSDRSSRSTSQCTAFYNPINSSLTNIAAVLREGSSEHKTFLQPQTLKDICIQSVMSLPFGQEIIEELANVSVSIDKITHHIYSRLKDSSSNSPPQQLKDINHNSCTSDAMETKWIGMPTEEDPSLLVCLSPAQKVFIETVRKPPKEADCLLDLHKKYIDRSYEYHSSQESHSNLYDLKIGNLNRTRSLDESDSHKRNSSYIDFDNYTKRKGPQGIRNKLNSNDDGNINYNAYIKKLTREVPIEVEKTLHKPVNNLVYDINTEEKRLSAKHLDEWMEALDGRNTKRERIIPIKLDDVYKTPRTLSTSDEPEDTKTRERIIPIKVDADYKRQRTLSASDAPKERIIPIKLEYSTDDETKKQSSKPGLYRRYSLPYDLYEKQLQYILEKEQKIEMEIKKLEEERLKLENESKKLTNGFHNAEEGAKSNGINIRKESSKTENMQNIKQRNEIFKTEKSKETKKIEDTIKATDDSKETIKSNEIARKENMQENTMWNEILKTENSKETKKLDGSIKTENSQETIKSSETLRTENSHEIKKLNETIKIEKTKLSESKSEKVKFDVEDYHISKKGDIAILQNEKSKVIPEVPGELFRQRMYNEWLDEVTERQERKQHKVIKITKSETVNKSVEKAAGLGDEFMAKARARMAKLGLEEETEEEAEAESSVKEVEHIVVMDNGKLAESSSLPKHLQEFIGYVQNTDDECSASASARGGDPCRRGSESLLHQIDAALQLQQQLAAGFLFTTGVWSPNKAAEEKPLSGGEQERSIEVKPARKEEGDDPPTPPVWAPLSAGSSPTTERKEFRPLKFESPTLPRKNKSKESTPATTPEIGVAVPPPWTQQGATAASASSAVTAAAEQLTRAKEAAHERRLPTSHSAPAAGLSALGASASKLPKAQNPTITLLQKAREGQLPKGASYIEESEAHARQLKSKEERPPLLGQHDISVYSIKSEYVTESDNNKTKKMADLGPRKFEGIGPTTQEGVPMVLRSEVKDSNQARWYKRMYDTLHRAKHDNEYVTVRYKTRRGRYPYTSAAGYLSEPEPNVYDSDASLPASKYSTLDRRRYATDKENEFITYTVPRQRYTSSSASVKHSNEVYKNQPGRIEDYIPGHSSISEKEAKEWWDEVMEIFDGWLDDHSALPSINYMLSQVRPTSTATALSTHLEQQKHVPVSKSYMSQALKESGYESDSTLVFRRRDDTALQLTPLAQRQAYKDIQRGGEVPLHGLRKPAPERPKEPMPPPPPIKGAPLVPPHVQLESPRRYVENEVTIHYRSPVRQEIKEMLSEEELARKQAEAMRRIYQEERRRKYLQELQDMNSRRHTDNFIPAQKSPIPLNRYDDFLDDLSPGLKVRDSSPEPRLVARALYNFVGQTSRELTFRKGDIIFVRRQVDKNWYEGEHNAMIGLFPSNYVEIVPFEHSRATPRKAHEGQARAKFNFVSQSQLELSLAKGELVVLTRRVDDNWFEGRVGNRKGIFPVSYVDVLIDPGEAKADGVLVSGKPVASPAAHSLLLNGSAGGKESMGTHHYQPEYGKVVGSVSGSFHAKPATVTSTASLGRKHTNTSVSEELHIDTYSEPVPYRAIYKYRPQNDDELELQEGDTVFVLEKCDDGWFVGSSQRTGAFGTFPGNYVERM